jgi:hypothetical protein
MCNSCPNCIDDIGIRIRHRIPLSIHGPIVPFCKQNRRISGLRSISTEVMVSQLTPSPPTPLPLHPLDCKDLPSIAHHKQLSEPVEVITYNICHWQWHVSVYNIYSTVLYLYFYKPTGRTHLQCITADLTPVMFSTPLKILIPVTSRES